MIPIYKPTIAPYTKSAIAAIESGWISNHGEYLKLATELLQTKLNVNHAILMANGTVATHSLFLALQHFHPSVKKIYVPNHVFIAAINATLMVYPLSMLSVVQTDPDTFNMVETEQYLATLEKGAALLVVHTVGNIVNVPRIQRLRPDLIVLEDACEGLFGTYEESYAGTAAFASSVSFYGNKTITTGEGGAFLTPHEEVAIYIRRIYSQGSTNIRYVHDGIGYNYRMTNIEAAFLYDQLNDLSTILENKRKVYNTYVNLTKDLSGCRVQTLSPDTTHSTWMFSLNLPFLASFYPLLEVEMLSKGVELRPFFYSLPTHSHLTDLPVPNELSRCIVMLPSSPSLTYEEQVKVVDALQSSLQLFQPTLVSASVDSVTQFLSTAIHGEQTTFRYFKSRPVSVIETHLQTLLLTVKDVPIAYAHLEEEGVVWVGLCVLKKAQGCGYGTILLEALCKYADANAISLELTVDTSNTVAQHLYTKFKFSPTHLNNGIIRMQRGQLSLPVSIGEALDKLSILDIKMMMIKDERCQDVMKECDKILSRLSYHREKFTKLYTFLKEINLNIWKLQDELRASNVRDATYVTTCLQILDENDVRFRIKNKINKISNSVLKEQKGYPPKQALFVCHLGMGDMINMVGAVRYYSLQYDIVRIIAKEEYAQNVRELYSDDPTILIVTIPKGSYEEEMHATVGLIQKYRHTHTLLLSGILYNIIVKKQNVLYLPTNMDIIEQFYKELNIPLSVNTDYFWVGRSTPKEDLERLPNEYIFLHDSASNGTKLLPAAPTSSDTRFIVHPNRNVYEPDSPWYALAESFVGKPLLYYTDIVSNAVELHLIDSSFFCLAVHLPRPNCTKHIVYTRTHSAMYESIAPKSIWTYISL